MSMDVVYGDANLGVRSSLGSYLFSYEKGGWESLRKDGVEWLFRSPRPTFWRATTDNDRGNGFPLRSAIWMGSDLFCRVESHRAVVDGTELSAEDLSPLSNSRLLESPLRKADSVSVIFRYRPASVPEALVDVCYTVTEEGMEIHFMYQGVPGLPELGVLGLRWIMPFLLPGFTYTGLSGETYPDRMSGGEQGTWQVDGLPVAKYLVPQECGMHMESSRLDFEWKGSHVRITALEKPFAFSLLPYTALELESAWHQDELPPPRRSVLVLASAVRGVGGIDSWGSDVANPWHIDATKRYEMTVKVV